MSAALAVAREQTVRIACLNDLARRAMGIACTAVANVGLRSLPDADQSRVRELIETYDAFDEDNDPHGERDFGTIYQIADGHWTTERPADPLGTIFWKIDYFDRDLKYASDDPADPVKTRRVLTIMLAEEY